MPRRRLSMRTIREVLRLSWLCELSNRDVAASCHISANAVQSYLERASQAGLTWPLPEALGDTELEAMLFPPVRRGKDHERPMPDWGDVHQQLKRKGMTLQLLWQEYRCANPDGYARAQYCHHYNVWKQRAEPRMLQQHKAGDKLFVDYAGATLPVTDRQTGEIARAQVFVAALGASNYIYAEATWTQSLADWVASHVRCFTFLGGVPRLVVPDNLKSGVTSPCRYEPDINPTYHKLAMHYGVAVVPARVRKPRDKAKVENAVLQVERRILARLRNHTFHSLEEINEAIRPLLDALNTETMKAVSASRQDLFDRLDKPALRPLPEAPFVHGVWSKARVNPDYHVAVERHRYSVPFSYIGTVLDVHVTANTVELFHLSTRIASHWRSNTVDGVTTIAEHMPSAHQHANCNDRDLLKSAAAHGPQTFSLISAILSEAAVPEQARRSCVGILRLGDRYGADRLEAAASIAHRENIKTYKSVASILKNGTDEGVIQSRTNSSSPIEHDNVRGADYYRQNEEAANA